MVVGTLRQVYMGEGRVGQPEDSSLRSTACRAEPSPLAISGFEPRESSASKASFKSRPCMLVAADSAHFLLPSSYSWGPEGRPGSLSSTLSAQEPGMSS